MHQPLHQFSGSAGFDTTPRLRASAAVALGRPTRDAACLPTTLNAAVASTVPALAAAGLYGGGDVAAALTENTRLTLFVQTEAGLQPAA